MFVVATDPNAAATLVVQAAMKSYVAHSIKDFAKESCKEGEFTFLVTIEAKRADP